MTTQPLLDVSALATRLAVTKDYAYRLIERGEIAVTRIGRRVMVTEEAVAEFVAARTAPPRRSRKGTAA